VFRFYRTNNGAIIALPRVGSTIIFSTVWFIFFLFTCGGVVKWCQQNQQLSCRTYKSKGDIYI